MNKIEAFIIDKNNEYVESILVNENEKSTDTLKVGYKLPNNNTFLYSKYDKESDSFIPVIQNDLNEILRWEKDNKIKELNKIRNKEVSTITMTVDNITLDGNEKSQERISRAITALDPEETTFWIDVNGEAQELSREQLKMALKLAGQKQTEIFVEYAQKKAELLA